MSTERDDGILDSIIEEVKHLERSIAEKDYELRTIPPHLRKSSMRPTDRTVKEQVKQFEGLYAKRDELVNQIPDFWLRVFEFFYDSSIETPNIEDFELLSYLSSFKVSRDKTEPKEVEFIFTFTPNEYLADDSLVLKKSFSNLQSPDPDSHITSTKVPINWKEGKDFTEIVKGVPPSFFRWFAFEGNSERNDDFPNSEEIAVELADEIYPHAHRIFQESVIDESDEVDMEEDLEDSDEDEEVSDDEKEHPARKRRKSH